MMVEPLDGFHSCASKKITTLSYLSVESQFYLYIHLKYITVLNILAKGESVHVSHKLVDNDAFCTVEANPDRIIDGTTRRVVTSVANPNRRASIIRSTIERFHPLSCVS
jgi:hypothetical protein